MFELRLCSIAGTENNDHHHALQLGRVSAVRAKFQRQQVFSAKKWGTLWNVGAKCNVITARSVLAPGQPMFEYDFNKFASKVGLFV